MKYYVELSLLPDADIGLGFLWQKVYQQVHLALVEHKVADHQSAIGLSFPKYGDTLFPLGDKLRLFAHTEEQLQALDIAHWLRRLTDYTHCTSIREVSPKVDKFVRFQRFNIKSNFEKKAARRAKHLGKPLEEVMQYMRQEDQARGVIYETKEPFIEMTSLSSKQERFKLFIVKEELSQAQEGYFSCYGLSRVATVPCFP